LLKFRITRLTAKDVLTDAQVIAAILGDQNSNEYFNYL
jgi:hypothetical protein